MTNANGEHPVFSLLADIADPKAIAYLKTVMQQKGIDETALLESSGLRYVTPYTVYGGRRKLMRDMIIQLAVGLRASEQDASKLLTQFGFDRLDLRNKRDAAILYCLEHEYPFTQTQSFLTGQHMKPLGESI